MADDEQFSLCWNNFNTNLSAGFHESLLRGDLVDVTLAAEGQLVKAHRLILSVCSPYFRKMLTQVPATQHAFIFLKDVSHSALKDLIQFMYCGEVNVKQDALPAFISTAEALQIKGLTETGDSAPAQQSPAKEVIAAPPATISVPIATATGGSPRTKVQRTRVHSYKLESEESGDDKVQIQAGSSHHVTAQQVQQQTQHTTTQKRTLQQRTVIPIQPSKRTKLSVASVEALEAPEATPQVQTVQIVKQVLEPDYVEIPIESINAKAEPEYADETGEIETVETEAEQEHTLTEHEQSVEQEQADDDGNYVEDEYAEMGKFEESYFTEGEDAKAGASGFGDSYTSDGGTGTEQSAQGAKPVPPQSSSVKWDSSLNNPSDALEEDQSSPEDHIAVFTRTMRGKEQLLYLGQPFVFEKLAQRPGGPPKKIWRCNQWWNQKCRARVYTVDRQITPLNRYHTHTNIVKRKQRITKARPANNRPSPFAFKLKSKVSVGSEAK
ncbi:modifier of mdg4-like isoform X8 [Anopheles ziemanni]|uniref:modifier of mdg4-like isoform X18 n=1 Tax=Anopheles coustani TaxID=139045 RepID=UPI0026592262|nr:modifier of mdg4-like isoform X18 [Anopheles coustani]XP_058170966.1 modifier of mdg4-like isoform X8 [Anopheles ziemanni]